jgi:hypothetical protein
VYRSGQTCQVGWSPKQCTAYRLCSGSACGTDEVQIGGKQYTRVAGLAWIPVTEDQPAPPPEPPKQRTAERRTRQPQPQQFDPIGAFVGVMMLPFDFFSYPGRR